MTPLQRDVHIPIYWLVVGLAVMVVSPVLSIFASVQIANHNRDKAEQAAATASAEAKEEGRLRICGLFGALLDTYVEAPPTTQTGKRVQATYLEFYTLNQCQPPRTK